MTKYHPSDTAQLVPSSSIDNFALSYRHFLPIKRDGAKYKFELSDPTLGDSTGKLIDQLRERQTEQLLQLVMQDIKLYCVDATVDWRLIVGLGSEHVQETNMTLHHIYGIPYIPGSAVKGVLRHWWLQENFGDNENRALKDENFLALFGSQNLRGEVQFLDAYPEEVHFAKDIMNPHYPNYYSGSAPPTDSQNPNPIPFLTVEKTSFRFAFLSKKQRLLDQLKARFEDVLELKGIGAKTAVGYGYFRNFEDQTEKIIDTFKRQQQAEREEAERQRETERLASLSPVEQLVEELNGLAENSVDEARVTDIYNTELQSLAGDEQRMVAQALKDYWERINKWSGGSRKQRTKVQEVKSILGES